jgi:hypothetical protein
MKATQGIADGLNEAIHEGCIQVRTCRGGNASCGQQARLHGRLKLLGLDRVPGQGVGDALENLMGGGFPGPQVFFSQHETTAWLWQQGFQWQPACQPVLNGLTFHTAS